MFRRPRLDKSFPDLCLSNTVFCLSVCPHITSVTHCGSALAYEQILILHFAFADGTFLDKISNMQHISIIVVLHPFFEPLLSFCCLSYFQMLIKLGIFIHSCRWEDMWKKHYIGDKASALWNSHWMIFTLIYSMWLKGDINMSLLRLICLFELYVLIVFFLICFHLLFTWRSAAKWKYFYNLRFSTSFHCNISVIKHKTKTLHSNSSIDLTSIFIPRQFSFLKKKKKICS